MTMPDPRRYAEEWIEAWNARDVEAVLAHFHDNAVFSSPIALKLGHGTQGAVSGKDAIRRYWTSALQLNPELRFRIDSVHAGVNALVIGFMTQDDVSRAEILIFENGLVRAGHGTVTAGVHDAASPNPDDGGLQP